MIRKIITDALLLLAIIGLLYTKYIDISFHNTGKPDLLLIFIVFIGLFEGGYHPIIFGFIGGLAVDCMSGSAPLGFFAFIYTVIGYISIVPNKFFMANSPLLAPLLIVVFFFIKTFMYIAMGYLFLSHESIINYVNNVLLVEIVYTVVVSVFIFIVMKKIYTFVDKLKKHV